MGEAFLPLLAVLLIGLKLGGVIAWSWAWVLLPIWGPIALFVVIGLGMLVYGGLSGLR